MIYIIYHKVYNNNIMQYIIYGVALSVPVPPRSNTPCFSIKHRKLRCFWRVRLEARPQAGPRMNSSMGPAWGRHPGGIRWLQMALKSPQDDCSEAQK